MTKSAISVEVRPLTATCGAEIGGVDLARPLDDATYRRLRTALVDHGVIFFRDQRLDDVAQNEFARRFGEPDIFPFGERPTPEAPAVHVIAFDGATDAEGKGADEWHADVTFIPTPPMGTVLRAVELPPYGGDTCFSNMSAAFDALSPAIREMIDGLKAVHDYRVFAPKLFRTDPAGAADKLEARAKSNPPVEHPVVRTHPESGRRVLFVNRNYTSRIVGLTERENEMLLPYLFDHARDPMFQCRFQWRPGSVAFWDNRLVQHYAVADYRARRRMHRVVIKGDVPY
jgi:taurine dioxygenase